MRLPVRRGLAALLWVRHSWFEWVIEDGRRRCALVVEVEATVARCTMFEEGPDRVRIVSVNDIG